MCGVRALPSRSLFPEERRIETMLVQDPLPVGKVLMPGLIAHSTNVVEHPDLVAERLLRYADIVGRDNVMAGTDCGFSQSPLAGRVHRSIMWAKLKCLAEGAAIASKLLWH